MNTGITLHNYFAVCPILGPLLLNAEAEHGNDSTSNDLMEVVGEPAAKNGKAACYEWTE
jgi:hypothetical protein